MNPTCPAGPLIAREENSPEGCLSPGETGISPQEIGCEEGAVGSEAAGGVRMRGTEASVASVAVDAVIPTEEDLVRRARDGDRDAFGALVLRHQDAVYGYAWRILKSREDAEDSAQESFLRAWRGLHSFDPARPFRPWILRIAINVALNARSRRRSHVELGEAIAVEDGSDGGLPAPVAAASRREILEAVRRMVGDLSPENAALFQLRYGEQLSLKEISQILDRRPGTLASTLHRIRERLRRALFGHEKGVEP